MLIEHKLQEAGLEAVAKYLNEFAHVGRLWELSGDCFTKVDDVSVDYRYKVPFLKGPRGHGPDYSLATENLVVVPEYGSISVTSGDAGKTVVATDPQIARDASLGRDGQAEINAWERN